MTVIAQPQRWIDAAILLALWTKATRKPLEDAGDRLRLMKLAFLAAHDLHEQRFRALGLTFYRWMWGPLSNEVYEVWEMLTAAGLLDEEERFLITPEGAELADDFAREVLGDEPNDHVRRTVDRIAEAWAGRMATKPLLDHVYGLKVKPVGRSRKITTRSAYRGQSLVAPPEGDLAGSLVVGNDWIETLGLCFSPTHEATLRQAERDFRDRRFAVARSA